MTIFDIIGYTVITVFIALLIIGALRHRRHPQGVGHSHLVSIESRYLDNTAPKAHEYQDALINIERMETDVSKPLSVLIKESEAKAQQAYQQWLDQQKSWNPWFEGDELIKEAERRAQLAHLRAINAEILQRKLSGIPRKGVIKNV